MESNIEQKKPNERKKGVVNFTKLRMKEMPYVMENR